MAKKSSEEYLAGILNLLDEVITENKKSAKAAGQSNIPNTSILAPDAYNIKVLGDSLKVLSSAIVSISKVSTKQVESAVKNIKILSEAIQSLKMSKEDSAQILETANTVVKLNEMFSSMTQNFFKTYFTFSPLKARILGRRLRKFYQIVFDNLKKLVLSETIKAIDAIPSNDDFGKKIANLSKLIQIIRDIPMKDVLKMWTMGILLGPKTGNAIGGFFAAIVDSITKNDADGKKAEKAIGIAKVVTKLIGMLTLSLVIMVGLALFIPADKLAIGFGMLVGLVVGTYVLMKALSSKNMKDSQRGAMHSALGIAALLGTLTLSLVILIWVNKKFPVKQVVKGFALLVGLVGVAFLLMKALSSSTFKKSSKESLWGVAAIVLLLFGMSLAMLITISVGKHAKEIFAGGVLVVGFTLLNIFVMKALSKLKKKTLINGLIAAAAIGLMIAGISASMLVFGAFLKQIHDVTAADIAWGIGLTVGMIVGMGAIAFAASSLVMGPQAIFFFAGFGAVETIALMIASISNAMNLFADFVTRISKLTDDDFNRAFSRIGGDPGLVSCLTKIVNALSDVSGRTMIKMAFIGKSLKPVFESLSMFVDVIQKMAKMEILDHYDNNGKPVYRKMENKEFADAAITVTNAFTYFLTTLSTGLEKISNAAYLRQVIDALFPPQPGGFIGLFKSKKKGIGDIIPCISNFIDVIIKMASMTVPVEWNKDGVAIKYRRIENKEFVDAAKAVTDSFVYFITELSSGLTKISNLDSLKRIIEMLFPAPKKVKTGLFRSKMVEQPGIGSVIIALSGFMDILIKMANSLVPDEWDKDGNPIHFRKIEKEEWIQAAITTTDCFITFLSRLSDDLSTNVNPLGLAVMKLLSSAGIDKITESVGNLMQPLMQLAVGKIQVGEEVVDIDPNKLQNSVEPIVNSLVTMLKLLKKNFNESGWLDASNGADSAFYMCSDFSRAIAMMFSKDGKVAGGDSDGKDFMKIDEITMDRINMVSATMDLLYSIKLKFNENGWKDAAKGADSAWSMANDMSRAMAMLFSPDGVVKGGKSNGKTYLALNNLNDNTFNNLKRALGITYGISKYLNTHIFNTKKALEFSEQMKYTAKGLKTILPFTKSTPSQLRDIAKALKELDVELVEKEKKRTDAIQSLSSNFKDMAENIQQLNDTLNQSMELTNRYNRVKLFSTGLMQQKGAQAIVNATEQVRDTVSNVVDRAKAAITGNDKTNEEKNKANMQELAQVIANAVTQSLDAWARSNKELTVKFDQSPKTIFGNVEIS